MINKNYMKMCVKAKQIQKLWKPEIGDWCLDPDAEASQLFSIGDAMLKHPTRWNCWLPTQEQLWAMLFEIKDKVHVLFRFNKFLSGKYISDSAHVAFLVLSNMPKEDEEDFSITELLFYFVMKERYNKIWNGEDWAKE